MHYRMALNFYQAYKGSQNNLIGRCFMNFRKLILEGAFLIEPEKIEDDRCFFERSLRKLRNPVIRLLLSPINCSDSPSGPSDWVLRIEHS